MEICDFVSRQSDSEPVPSASVVEEGSAQIPTPGTSSSSNSDGRHSYDDSNDLTKAITSAHATVLLSSSSAAAERPLQSPNSNATHTQQPNLSSDTSTEALAGGGSKLSTSASEMSIPEHGLSSHKPQVTLAAPSTATTPIPALSSELASKEKTTKIPTDTERQFNQENDDDGPPDGGLRAWAVVAGGLINYIATFGLLNSFGTFQTYYQDHFLAGTSPSTISWIGSVQLFLLFVLGLVVGPAFDKFGARRLTIPGTFLYVLSLMLTSLGTKFYQLLLAQGFLFGIADAMVYFPTISAINMWFDKKRGIALGIVVSGSSIGDVIWPILVQCLLGKVGFAWTTRIVGLICLGLMIVSTTLIVGREGSKPAQPAWSARVAQPEGGPTDLKSLRRELTSRTYILVTAAFSLSYLGMFIPFYYLPSYGIAHGMTPTMANYLLSILNGGSFFGRIVSGLIADRFGVFNITVLSSMLSAITLLSWLAIKTQSSIIAFSALYGLFSGGLISLQALSVARLTTDMETYGTKIGVQMAVNSIGVLIGNPIAGAIIQHQAGAFSGMQILSGVTVLAGFLLFLVSRMLAAPGTLKF